MDEETKYLIHIERIQGGKVHLKAERGEEVIEHTLDSMQAAVVLAEEIADYFAGGERNESD